MKIEFDEYGYLKPYELIEIDIETLEEIFIKAFRASKTRNELFINYVSFLDAFQVEVVASEFIQWINGSFVTKKLNPQDLDIVTLIDNQTYKLKEKEITYFQSIEFYQKTNMDCYFLRVYPENDPKYIRTKSDLAYWENQFSFIRKSRILGKPPRKGFIQLNF